MSETVRAAYGAPPSIHRVATMYSRSVFARVAASGHYQTSAKERREQDRRRHDHAALKGY
ncbi:TPA: hypothetical protein ACXNQL_000177 [Stenotrophomonas maltophilia]